MADLETRTLELIVIRVRPTPLSLALSQISSIVDRLLSSGATVDSIVGNVVLAYWTPMGSRSPRQEIAEGIANEFGEKVSLLHGVGHFEIGNYGTDDRMHHGVLGPMVDNCWKRLFSLPLGSVEAFDAREEHAR